MQCFCLDRSLVTPSGYQLVGPFLAAMTRVASYRFNLGRQISVIDVVDHAPHPVGNLIRRVVLQGHKVGRIVAEQTVYA